MAKKHGSSDIRQADVHQDEEMHVTRTTPQGTQEAGVDKGHELRDIKIRELLYWFGGLTVFTAITIAAMCFLVMLLTSHDRIEKTRLSTPLYGIDEPRRVPELLPNPQQLKPGGGGYRMPWDHYRAFVKDESREMHKIGLEDDLGRPAMPVSAVTAVETSAEAKPAGSADYRDEVRPSDSTGGTKTEAAILTR